MRSTQTLQFVTITDLWLTDNSEIMMHPCNMILSSSQLQAQNFCQ